MENMENIEKKISEVLTLANYASVDMLFNPGYYILPNKQKVLRYLTSKKAKINEQGRNEPCKCGSGLKYKKCCSK